MFEKARKAGTVRFALRPEPGVSKVAVAVDALGWEPIRMTRQKNGTFVRILQVDKPVFEYKFLIDDTWATDPDHSHWSPNPFGTFNSVGQVD